MQAVHFHGPLGLSKDRLRRVRYSVGMGRYWYRYRKYWHISIFSSIGSIGIVDFVQFSQISDIGKTVVSAHP